MWGVNTLLTTIYGRTLIFWGKLADHESGCGKCHSHTEKRDKTARHLARDAIPRHMRRMELTLPLTVILTIVSGFFTALFGYMGTRPMNVHKGPRMVPWTFLMLLFFTATLFLIVHLLNLVGIQTKPPEQFPRL
jgi:lysylphosphatidylglycerol synthetase-like protein (DUF2156 family)